MNIGNDEKGFVFTGFALLVILPSLLIAASYLTMTVMGGESSAIGTISSSVRYTGEAVERTIERNAKKGISIDAEKLRNLEDNFETYTGLTVDLTLKDGGNYAKVQVEDPGGTARYVGESLTVAPPVADAGGPYATLENENVRLIGEDTFDPHGDIEYYRWKIVDDPTDEAYLSDEDNVNAWFHAPESVENFEGYQVELEVLTDDNVLDSDDAWVWVFENVEYTLEVSIEEGTSDDNVVIEWNDRKETIEGEGDEDYHITAVTEVTLTANPKHDFYRWEDGEDNILSYEETIFIRMMENMRIEAYFE